MQKVVFDTNVLLSAVLSSKGASYALVRLAAEGKVFGYTSKTLVGEFKEIVRRDYSVQIEWAERMVGSYVLFLKLVEPDFRLRVVEEDEDDNRVLECGVFAKADYITSWDSHLTDLVEYERIKILNPGKMLEVLKKAHGIE